MTEDSSHAASLRQARSHLHDADPVLAQLVDERPGFDPRAWIAELPAMDLFGALLFQVTGQQLSVLATRRTLSRIEDPLRRPSPVARRVGAGRAGPSCATPDSHGGRSAPCATWRSALRDGRLDPDVLSSQPDDELLAQLTAIPGIGPWTVQGALIIALQREDVVLPGDLALRKAVRTAYQLDHLPTQQEVLAIAEKWRPYRSLATSYLFSAAFEPAGAPPTTPRET